ncbi:MAG: triose-phosphate isomerase [Alphaproteobacteria bacterium]|nr:triose-phosphate isomerase [Alphaproteobacteria bacterium]
MKKLIAGNWKMNGGINDAKTLIANIINTLSTDDSQIQTRSDILICPPFLHIPAVRHSLHSNPHIALGAQDCSIYEDGAHTGDISAAMLKDSGCSHVIIGHSERRQNNSETDDLIARKARLALDKDLMPIICVGETAQERESGEAENIVTRQIRACVPELGTFEEITIAYEPVWAIGTGKIPTPDDVTTMHSLIRRLLKEKTARPERVRILYGGSLKPDNAKILLALPNVDGGLIGGASLKAKDFLAIAAAA